MLRGEIPTARRRVRFEIAMILHAEHEMNASTFTARVVAGTNADMHSAIVAAISALKGPLHGGANQAAMAMLEEFGSPAGRRGRRPRAARGEEAALRLRPSALPHDGPACADPAPALGAVLRRADRPDFLELAKVAEAEALEQKGLWPNVDLYSGVLYHELGIPTDLFIPLFEMSRVAGQAAHVLEQHAGGKIIRPSAEYVGEPRRDIRSASRAEGRDDERLQARARRRRRVRDGDRRARPRGRLAPLPRRRHRGARRARTVRAGLGPARRRELRAGPAGRPSPTRARPHRRHAGRPPVRDRAARRRWGLGKLIDISDDEAREDLRRALGASSSRSRPSRRGSPTGTTTGRAAAVAQGATTAERFLLEWRGEADPKHVQALDTYWICTCEHGLNASTFAARITASTGSDCAAALSSAVGALSGPLHGGAPARVLPMLDAAAESGDPERYVQGADRARRAADGLRPPRLPRRGPARAAAATDGEGARRAALRGRRQARGRRARGAAEEVPDRPLETNVEFWSAVVLDVAEIPPQLAPAMFACSRTAGWSAHILEQKKLSRLVRPSARYVGPGARPASADLVNLAEAAARADELAAAGDQTALATLRAAVGRGARAAARSPDYRIRAQAYRAIAQFRFRQKLELVRRGLQDESPAAGARR